MNKDTRMKKILNNPAAMDVMDKHLPGIKEDKRLKMAGMMSVEQIMAFIPGGFTEEQQAALYADLATIPE